MKKSPRINSGVVLCSIGCVFIAGAILFSIINSPHLSKNTKIDASVSDNNEDIKVSENDIKVGSTPWIVEDDDMLLSLDDYNSMSIILTAPETLSENDIKRYVDETLKSYPEYKEITDKDRVIQKGDHILLKLSGEAVEDNSLNIAENEMYVTVSNNEVNEVIDSMLPGRKAGDSFVTEYTYPDSFDDEAYRGKKVLFSVYVSGIYNEDFRTYETIDDRFVQEYMDCLSVDDFITRIKYEMYGISTEDRNTQLEEGIEEQLTKICSFDIPQSLLDQKFDQQKQFFINQVCDGDESLYEDKLKSYIGKSPADYKTSLMEEIRKNTEYEIIATAIDKKENLYNEEGFIKYVNTQVGNYDSIENAESLFRFFDSTYESGEEYMRKRFLIAQMMDFIRKHIEIKTSENASVVDLIQKAAKVS